MHYQKRYIWTYDIHITTVCVGVLMLIWIIVTVPDVTDVKMQVQHGDMYVDMNIIWIIVTVTDVADVKVQVHNQTGYNYRVRNQFSAWIAWGICI